VLDFTWQLLEAGVENDFVLALVVFSLQYVFLNHEYWKYKAKQDRWKVTLQVCMLFSCSALLLFLLRYFGNMLGDAAFVCS